MEKASAPQLIRIYVIGFCMGVADLIPGVSGGTIAFISGIYGKLINGIKSFDIKGVQLAVRFKFKELWKHIPFLFFIPLGLGIVTAVVSLSKLLESLFHSHPEWLWSFFFGLILGSIFLLFLETRPWRMRDSLIFILSAIFTFWVVGLPATQTPASPLYVFLAGCIAISAMILPGISGSYILVILGKYQQILDAINTRDFITLMYFFAGMVVGVLSMVRIVSWLLGTYRHLTIISLTGVMTGALRTVWPWKETVTTRIDSSGDVVPVLQRAILPDSLSQVFMAFFLLGTGACIVVLLSKMKPKEEGLMG
ncbi:MAG: DUF368 domain-containing protein [Opitutales bacterium]